MARRGAWGEGGKMWEVGFGGVREVVWGGKWVVAGVDKKRQRTTGEKRQIGKTWSVDIQSDQN